MLTLAALSTSSLIAWPAVRTTSWSLSSMVVSVDALEARVGPVAPPNLGTRPAIDHHDVRGEVVGSAYQRGAHAIGIDRNARLLERRDLLGREATGRHDPHAPVAGVVEGGADEPHEFGVHARRATAGPERLVHEQLRRIEPDAPEVVAERIRDLDRGASGVVVEVDKH